MSNKKDEFDVIIDSIDEAYEKMHEYAGIVNGYQDGIPDDRLEEDEAERLADSWYKTLEDLSDKVNIDFDTMVDLFNIIDYSTKRKLLKQAQGLQNGTKLKIGAVR